MTDNTKIVVGKDRSLSYLASPTVKIIVGGDTASAAQAFFVHAELLTARSTFFAKALKNYTQVEQNDGEKFGPGPQDQDLTWREGAEGVIRLPVDEPDMFRDYVQLLYSGVLPIFDQPQESEKVSDTTTQDDEIKNKEQFKLAMDTATELLWMRLAKLYVFCEKVHDVGSKQIVLAAFVEIPLNCLNNGYYYYPSIAAIATVYAGTLPLDPLRAFVVDCYVCEGDLDWVEEPCDQYPHKFLYDFMVRTWELEAIIPNTQITDDPKYYQEKLAAFEKVKGNEEPDV